jgi:hypothetical protein
MEQTPNRKRQVPAWVPLSILAVILAGFIFLRIQNPMWLELAPTFPIGLAMLVAEPFQPMNNSAAWILLPLVVASYCLYIVLFAGVFLAREWRTFGIIGFILICVILLNLAGCRQMAAGLSEIH